MSEALVPAAAEPMVARAVGGAPVGATRRTRHARPSPPRSRPSVSGETP